MLPKLYSMWQSDITMTMHIHFVGVGGIHMSGLAHMLLDDGLNVSGCDRSDAPILQPLRDRGARILVGHHERHVRTATHVVRTAAVPSDHPEIAQAIELGIPVQTRAELLSQLASSREVIAVGGTHGKTTTTAMIAHAMTASGRDAGYVIGGEAPDFSIHARRGSDSWLVLEADEYGRAFHHYRPAVAVLTNCETDHLDYYGSPRALEDAFLGYLRTIRPNGTLVVGIDSPLAASLADRLRTERPNVQVRTCSARSSADYQIRSIAAGASDSSGYELTADGAGHVGSLTQPGEYQLQNAVAALAALDVAGFDLACSVQALTSFRGVKRRFQLHGETNDVVVLDDYAHHPTEIVSALAAARERWPGRRIVVLFQPHTYTRTSYLLDGFRTCFAQADVVYTVDTYAARAMSGAEMTSQQLAREIVSPTAQYGGSIADSAQLAAAHARAGDLIITIGAGDVDAAGPMILDALAGVR